MARPDAVLRFAPSPNGHLHLGHAYSALTNERLAKARGGRLLLRMEDIDQSRCRATFEDSILRDLEWLGIAFDPLIRRQSEHFTDYARALDQLADLGLLYPCFCTRGEIARAVAADPSVPRDPDGVALYPGTCRHLAQAERDRRLELGTPPAFRLDMAKALALVNLNALQRGLGPMAWREFGEGIAARDVAAHPERWGDVILARRDIPTSYHVSVVIDDALQGITAVVRGEDLQEATSLHLLLQRLLDLPTPDYHHHGLLRDAQGLKLSKSTHARALHAVRDDGITPSALRQQLGFG